MHNSEEIKQIAESYSCHQMRTFQIPTQGSEKWRPGNESHSSSICFQKDQTFTHVHKKSVNVLANLTKCPNCLTSCGPNIRSLRGLYCEKKQHHNPHEMTWPEKDPFIPVTLWKPRRAWWNCFIPVQVSGGLNWKLATRLAKSQVSMLYEPHNGKVFGFMCHRATIMGAYWTWRCTQICP